MSGSAPSKVNKQDNKNATSLAERPLRSEVFLLKMHFLPSGSSQGDAFPEVIQQESVELRVEMNGAFTGLEIGQVGAPEGGITQSVRLGV